MDFCTKGPTNYIREMSYNVRRVLRIPKQKFIRFIDLIVRYLSLASHNPSIDVLVTYW